jgi:hypothetical protein
VEFAGFAESIYKPVDAIYRFSGYPAELPDSSTDLWSASTRL